MFDRNNLCKFFKFLIGMLSLLSLAYGGTANFVPEPPSLTSKAFILFDYNSARILLEKNSTARLSPASLTKIMTMYVIDQEIKAGRLKLNDEVQISKEAWQTSGSRMFLDVNSKVKVSDLIRGIIIQSGNDASVAMAEHIAGSDKAFASIMNSYATMLGMKDSHFVNSTGLPEPNHYSTAHDLAILAQASIQHHPESYVLYSQKSFMYNNIEQSNRNKLLWRNNLVDGIKTGQTEDAGYCLAASGIQAGDRLIAILLGSKSDEIRTAEANKLLTWGFRFFTSHKIYEYGNTLEKVRIWGGKSKILDIGLSQSIYISLLKHDVDQVSAVLSLPGLIKAPLIKGEQIGKYVVKLKGETIAEYPAIALHSINKGNFFYRLCDHVSMYFKSIIKPKSLKV